MKTDIIDNSGPNQLGKTIQQFLNKADSVDIAVAFATQEGVLNLIDGLSRVGRRGQCRILVGVWQWFTQPDALRHLLRAQHQADGGMEVRVARLAQFHAKLYCFYRGSSANIVVGSSNLTDKGLRSEGELNICLHGNTKTHAITQARNRFNSYWNSGRKLTESNSARYKREYEQNLPKTPRKSVPITKIFGRASTASSRTLTSKRRKNKQLDIRYWRDSTDCFMDPATEDLLGRSTDWDRRGWWYYSSTDARYRVGDRVLLFDFNENELWLIEIKETSTSPVVTPDGRHFVAYARIRGTKKYHFSVGLWARLRNEKLVSSKSAAHRRSEITEDKWDEFRLALRGLV